MSDPREERAADIRCEIERLLKHRDASQDVRDRRRLESRIVELADELDGLEAAINQAITAPF